MTKRFHDRSDNDAPVFPDLSRTQADLLHVLLEYYNQFARVPDVTVLASLTGTTSRTTLDSLLHLLAEKEYISVQECQQDSRLCYKLLDKALRHTTKALPLLDVIPAGCIRNIVTQPAKLVGTISDVIPGMRLTDRVVRVRGDWMMDKDIHRGNFVVIDPLQDYTPRDICALRTLGINEIILAHVMERKDMLLLSFGNAFYTEREIHRDEVVVLGVVTSVLSTTSFML